MSNISYDENGLPVAQWRESKLTTAHRCRIVLSPAGVPMFEYQNPRPGHIRRKVERFDQMNAADLCLALLRGEFSLRDLLLSGGLLLGFLGLSWLLTVMTGDRLAFLYVVFGGLFLVAVWLVVGSTISRMLGLRKGLSHDGIEVHAVPWTELSGFRVTDVKSVFGHVRWGEKGEELPPQAVLVADFTTTRAPLEISSWFNIGALNQLHADLTAAFIDRRPEHLDRLSRKRRGSPQQKATMPVRGGRIPAEERGSLPKEDESLEAIVPGASYEISISEDETNPVVTARVPLRTRKGEIAWQAVQFKVLDEKGEGLVFGAGLPVRAAVIGASDYFAEAPLDRVEGVSMAQAADWKDERFAEFVFEPDEHVLLLHIRDTEQRELLARSGVAPKADLEKLGVAMVRAIEEARGTFVAAPETTRRKVI